MVHVSTQAGDPGSSSLDEAFSPRRASTDRLTTGDCCASRSLLGRLPYCWVCNREVRMSELRLALKHIQSGRACIRRQEAVIEQFCTASGERPQRPKPCSNG